MFEQLTVASDDIGGPRVRPIRCVFKANRRVFIYTPPGRLVNRLPRYVWNGGCAAKFVPLSVSGVRYQKIGCEALQIFVRTLKAFGDCSSYAVVDKGYVESGQ